jgi:hypothetical protein
MEKSIDDRARLQQIGEGGEHHGRPTGRHIGVGMLEIGPRGRDQ